jgi:hypothetical protein
MANYKTHLSVGVFFGIIGAILSCFFLFGGHYILNMLIIIFVSIGSILPDLDSDESIPFKIVFWFFSILGGLALFIFLQKNGHLGASERWALSLIFSFFIRFVVGKIFMRFTSHRGMFHSIPAGLIFGLLCFYFLDTLRLSAEYSLILSFALFLGYISHLILDEIYAGVNFRGIFFIPKKSLGSALKFFSGSQSANTFTYFILSILLFFLWPKVNPEIFRALFGL